MIATSTKVDLKGVDEETIEKVGKEGYFTREKKQENSGEEAFFKQGEKPEVGVVDNFCKEESFLGCGKITNTGFL